MRRFAYFRASHRRVGHRVRAAGLRWVLAFQALAVPRMVGLPLPLRALLFPLVLLTLMTFVVMPVVTRVLRRWLGPRQDAEHFEG
jgi:antibiotic biosynthesis monooxygenase (ABM) superfamily enzyme